MRTEIIYKEIVDYIKMNIIEGKFTPNMKLPTESEFAVKFGSSRNTAVKALDILKSEGYIYRIQGKGSFVSPSIVNSLKNTINIVSLILPFSETDANRIDEFSVVRGVESFLSSNNYHLMIHYGNDDPGQEAGLIENCRNEKIDGVIVYPTTIHKNISQMYDIILEKYPIVFIDRKNSNLSIPCVQSDNIKGGFIATKHLLSRGYEDIYFVSDVPIDLVTSVRDRYFGYLKALKQADRKMDEHWLIDSYAMRGALYRPVSYEDNQQVFNDILTKMIEYSNGRRIGVFADNDLTAYSIIKSSLDRHLQIGENIGIVGFNNAQIASRSIVSITTVKQDFFKIGELSAKVLLDIIKTPDVQQKDIDVDVKLIIRDSTC